MRRAICLLLGGSLTLPAATRTCVGSTPVTSLRLTATPPGANGSPVPVLRLNNLPSGYRVGYQPVDLPADLKKDAKLTLVIVPRMPDGQLTVLEPRPAAGSTEWTTPMAAGIVVLVFAPQGLEEKRLTNLVTKDANLVSALADYADETAGLEAGLEAANEIEQDADDDSSRPPRPITPEQEAIFALVRALNPAVSGYNPLSTGRRAGAATMAGKGVEAFFENAGGIVPGGGILPAVKTWLMPDTEFRSVYALGETSGASDSMTLCAQVQPRGRNKLAYLWAYRLNNGALPPVTIQKDVHIPIGMRASVPVKLDKTSDWKLLDRAFDWKLVPQTGSSPALHIEVRPLVEERALRLDLRKFAGAAGDYRLEARWDWENLRPAGAMTLHKFGDLKAARIAPASQDRLITGSGPVLVDLTGTGVLFVERASLHRPGSTRQFAADLEEVRKGNAETLGVEIDTDSLRPGPYLLALSRVDGAAAEVPLEILPANPRLDGPPPHLNTGEREQSVTLSGTGLSRIEKLESDRADFTIAGVRDDGTRMEVKVRLHSDAKPGDAVTLMAQVSKHMEPLRFPGALQVTMARPKIQSAQTALPADLGIAPKSGEIPGGSWVSFAIKADFVAQPVLTLQCAETARTIQPLTLHAGEKNASGQLIGSEDGSLFLSLDAGTVGRPGCSLTATLESDSTGKSDPFSLGKVIRLPRIESLALTDEKSGDGYIALLRGFDLETIAKTGWATGSGLDVPELPRPIAGEGSKQSLRVVMPWPSPSPKAPLQIWLRGESDPRATKVAP